MEKNKIYLFNPSGCLSREAILAWQGKTLSVAQNYLVKEHLKSCALCNDAIEGFSNQTTRELHKNFSDISYAMQQHLIKPKRNVSRRMKLSLAAAIFLTLVGIFSLLKFIPVKETVPVAQEITPQVEKKSSVISSNDEITVPSQSKPKVEVNDNRVKEETVVAENNETVENKPAAPVKQSEPEVEMDAQAKSEENVQPQENTVIGYATKSAATTTKKSKAASASGVRYSEKALAVDYDNNSETTYFVVEQMALFDGGDINKFKAWVEEKISISNDMLATGNMTLTFTVDSNGMVKDVVVVKGLDPKTDSTAVSIVKKSPKWQPAMHKGKAVNVNLALPLNLAR